MPTDTAQTQLLVLGKKPALCFGGDLLKGKRKSARVLASRTPIHLVMRSDLARGSKSMLRKARQVEAIVRKQAAAQHLGVTDFVNVGNHLHMVIKIKARGSERNRSFARFVRAISGLIAREILNAQKSSPKLNTTLQNFWSARPFTRVVAGGYRAYKALHDYLTLNMLEAIGFDRAAHEIGAHGPPNYART